MAATPATDINSLLTVDPDYRSGRPCLRGTGITVHSVAAAHLGGATADDLIAANADLDPGLIHAALAYYYANREQIEADLDSDHTEAESLRAAYESSELRGDRP